MHVNSRGGYRAMINVVENLSAAKQHTEKNWFRWTTHLTHPVLASIGKGPLFRHGTNDHTGSFASRGAVPIEMATMQPADPLLDNGSQHGSSFLTELIFGSSRYAGARR